MEKKEYPQLEAVKQGEVTDEELNSAKAGVTSDLRAMCDSQGELEGFTLSQALDGLDYGPLELAALVEDVSWEDVVNVARSTECDMIYFLRAPEPEEDEEDEGNEDEETHGA